MIDLEGYRAYTDEELAGMYREGDEGALDALLVRYTDMVRIKAGSMFILGGDTTDLAQEGMVGLMQAARDYDCGRDASFRTFASLCVTRKLYDALRRDGSVKHLPLNTALSLQMIVGDEEGEEGAPLISILPDKETENPEAMVLDQERTAELQQALDRVLSPLERQVLELLLTGMGYVEIAHVLNRPEKSIDNALQRLRGKVRKLLAAEDPV